MFESYDSLRIQESRDRFVTHLAKQVLVVFGDGCDIGVCGHRLPHILSLRLPGIVAGTLQERCSHRGLAFSTGSACHDPQAGENHVLEAIGLERRARREVLRLSFSHLTTQEETKQAAEIIIDEAEKLARVSI